MSKSRIINEVLSRKAINFDLDTAMMNAYGVYPLGYKILQNEFEKAGYTHRQGSGYISNDLLTSDDVYQFIKKVTTKYEWLSPCVKEVDVTDISNQHSMLNTMRSTASVVWKDRPIPTPISVSESAKEKRVRTSERASELTKNEERIISRILNSKYAREFEELMHSKWKNGECPKRLLAITAYFTHAVINAMAVDAIEGIVNKSEEYNGDCETLHKQITEFLEEQEKSSDKQGKAESKQRADYNDK